jgi:hypothetical protein
MNAPSTALTGRSCPTEPADVTPVDVEPAAATTADSQAPLLDRLDELAAQEDEIRAMLTELQRPPTSS